MKQSFGPAALARVKIFLSALLSLLQEIDCQENMRIEIVYREYSQELLVKANTNSLLSLVNSQGDKIFLKWEIRDILKHLENTVGCLEDLRLRKQGTSELYFKIILSHPADQIKNNLETIDRTWCKHQVNKKTRSIDTNNSYINHKLLEENHIDFCGRQWLQQDFKDALIKSKHRVIAIVGESGIGKTEFICKYIQAHSNEIVGWYRQRGNLHEYFSPEQQNQGIPNKIINQDDILSRIKRAGNSSKRKNRGIGLFIIDGIDDLSKLGLEISILISVFRSSFPTWVKLVITTRRQTSLFSSLNEIHICSIHAHDERNKCDIREYIYLKTKDITQTESWYRDSSINNFRDMLFDISEGNFLWAYQLITVLNNKEFDFDKLKYHSIEIEALYYSICNHIIEQSKGEHINQLQSLTFFKNSLLNSICNNIDNIALNEIVSEILFFLGQSKNEQDFILFVEIVIELIEKGKGSNITNLINLMPTSHSYYSFLIQLSNWVKNTVYKKSFEHPYEINSDQDIASNFILGVKNIYQAKIFSSKKLLKEASNSCKLAVNSLNIKQHLKFWIQAQLALAYTEFLQGNLPGSWARLIPVENCISTHQLSTELGELYWIRGLICLELEKYTYANTFFTKATSIFESNNHIDRICTSINQQIKSNIYINQNKVSEQIKRVRNLANNYSLPMQIILSYLIESEYLVQIGEWQNALISAVRAEEEYKYNDCKVDTAVCKMLISRCYLGLGIEDKAIQYALDSIDILHRFQYFPLFCFTTYDSLFHSIENIEKRNNLSRIFNISDFHSIKFFESKRALVEKHVKKEVVIDSGIWMIETKQLNFSL